jgi:hypothetical protein
MRVLKEEAEIQETLPVSFVTDMMSKGWDEVGYLREASAAIKEAYKDTAKVEELMQDLMDAYLVFIGQLELYLHNEEDIIAPTEEPKEEKPEAKESTKEEDEEDIEEVKASVKPPKPELPEADFEIEPLTEPTSGSRVTAPAKSEVSDPFEFLIDFDEPDMTQAPVTDAELYDEEGAPKNRRLNG